jgi:hypothetical protein
MAVATGTAILGAAAIGAGASYLGSRNAASASRDAARTQADAADRAGDQQAYALERQLEVSEPFRTTGTTAMNRLAAMTQPGGRLTQDFAYDPFQYQADPGYAFRLKEGMNAMNATAAARGGLISGNALRAGQAYGQQMGSQEYGAAFNRYLQNYANAQNTFQMNRNNLIDPLKFLSGQGQAAAAGQAANIGTAAANTANLTTGAANALAAGQIGAANAYGSGLTGVGNAAQTAALMTMYNRRGASSYGQPSTNFYDYGGDRSGGPAPVTDYSEQYYG